MSDFSMKRASSVAASLDLRVDTDRYRERLFPLARAILLGASRGSIEHRRAEVIATVWDEELRAATADALARLRRDLEQRLADVAGAERDLNAAASASRLAPFVVDRVAADLVEANDKNIAALQRLEVELRDAPLDERLVVALKAVRGAALGAGVPRTEVRAALARAGRVASASGADTVEASVESVKAFARALATKARRRHARRWVAKMATHAADELPLLAQELRRLVSVPQPVRPDDDPIWVNAAYGLALELEVVGEGDG